MKEVSEKEPNGSKILSGTFHNKELLESIRYAGLIQKAMLPPENVLKRLLHEYFILFMPKSIISGDFYWVTLKNQLTYIVAADCTGHGVPGALMSFLGISFLNEIVKGDSSEMAGRILNKMREKVMEALDQTGEFDESKDGMDLSLCIINHEKNNLQFAGANNSIYIIRDETLLEIKADKMPVGINAQSEEPFSTNDVEIIKNDRIYMFTDGFPDQFGGAEGKKYKYRRFRKLLIEIHRKDMQEQCRILGQTIENWRGDNDQVDDILIMGFIIP